LRGSMRHAIIDRLRTIHEDQSQSPLRAGDQIRFRTTIDRGVAGSRLLDMDDLTYAGRLETVSDFFDDSTAQDSRLRGTVLLIIEHAENSNSPSKKRKTSKATTVPIEFDKAVRTFHDNCDHDFLRMGETGPRLQKNATQIAVEFPLIAETDPHQQTLLQLWRTDAWDFGDASIGGFDLRKEKRTFRKAFDYWGPYQDLRSEKDLRERIFRPVGSDPRFPHLPPMTFSIHDPNATTPPLNVKTFGRDVFNAAIRFVNHLQDPAASSLPFHDNFQVELDDGSDGGDVMTEIRETLQKDTSKLFDEILKDRWTTELWVLPQQPAPQKLCRFPANRPGSSGKLREFVSQQMLDEGHRKLYIEAHIWPV